MRNYIKDLAIHYSGDWNKIYTALAKRENVPYYECEESYITYFDEKYPSRLKELQKPPWILFYRGNVNLLKRSSVSIVGSRKASRYALEETDCLVKQLKDDYVIVSGLAVGIDAQAHQSALDRKSIGVIAQGFDYFYPKANLKLFEKMCRYHLVITEYPSFTRAKPYYFPFRNRIIAALSSKLFVMEARSKSGTVHSVEIALDLNRDIFCLPHPVNDEGGFLCNRLIFEGANPLTKENGKYII